MMYASSLRRVGIASSHRQHGGPKPRARHSLDLSLSSSRCHSSSSGGGSAKGENSRKITPGRKFSAAQSVSKLTGLASGTTDAVLRSARQQIEAVKTGKTRFRPRMPSTSTISAGIALVPITGAAWFATVYAFRRRLCEDRLQQVDGQTPSKSKGARGNRRQNVKERRDSRLQPGSAEDARLLQDMLSLPAKGVTVLCVDPPASFTGEAFLKGAFSGRAATVHVRAGEGDGSLVACLARGLNVQYVTAKLQLSSVVPGLGASDGKVSGGIWQQGQGDKLDDLGAVLETVTSALLEIYTRSQASDTEDHLPPVIVLDGLLGRVRAGESVSPEVEAVLRWCWTITGGRRLAHVILTAPHSMAVDGTLVRVKDFLNDGRLAPGMMQVVGLRAPDAGVAEDRFRARLSSTAEGGADGGGGANERSVRLAMELVHGEDFGVAEEANEVLRRLSSQNPSLDGALEGIAFEAWRRALAAVTSATMAQPVDGLSTLSGSTVTQGGRGVDSQGQRREKQERRIRQHVGTGLSSGGVSAGRQQKQQQQQQQQQQDVASEEQRQVRHRANASSGQPEVVVDGRLPLGAPSEFLDDDDPPIHAGEGDGGMATVSDSDGDFFLVLAPMTPLEQLLRLMEILADGGKVSVADAVAGFGGDATMLGRLVRLGRKQMLPTVLPTNTILHRTSGVLGMATKSARHLKGLELGVLRLRPRTVSSKSSSSLADDADDDMSRALRLRTIQGARGSGVLPEAALAFEVGAATPLIEGVFAILRGCKGFEEQALVRATAFMGGTYGVAGRAEELQHSRDAFMATLLERALVAGGSTRSGHCGDGRRAGALSTRRVQTLMAAAGCMLTRREIHDEMKAAKAERGEVTTHSFVRRLFDASKSIRGTAVDSVGASSIANRYGDEREEQSSFTGVVVGTAKKAIHLVVGNPEEAADEGQAAANRRYDDVDATTKYSDEPASSNEPTFDDSIPAIVRSSSETDGTDRTPGRRNGTGVHKKEYSRPSSLDDGTLVAAADQVVEIESISNDEAGRHGTGGGFPDGSVATAVEDHLQEGSLEQKKTAGLQKRREQTSTLGTRSTVRTGDTSDIEGDRRAEGESEALPAVSVSPSDEVDTRGDAGGREADGSHAHEDSDTAAHVSIPAAAAGQPVIPEDGGDNGTCGDSNAHVVSSGIRKDPATFESGDHTSAGTDDVAEGKLEEKGEVFDKLDGGEDEPPRRPSGDNDHGSESGGVTRPPGDHQDGDDVEGKGTDEDDGVVATPPKKRRGWFFWSIPSWMGGGGKHD